MRKIILTFIFCLSFSITGLAESTSFTYQGALQSSGSPANGNYDLEFKVFDDLNAGTQQGSTVQRFNVAVTNGIFTVSLDFGAVVFAGADRFLDVAIRPAGGGAFTPLSPREKISSAPYAVRSLNATTADSATDSAQLGGVAANQYVLTGDPRMTDSRPPTGGSANYIQNQAAGPQASSNFTISGNGFMNGSGGIGTSSDTFLATPARFTVVQQQSGQWATHVATNNFSSGSSFGLLLDAGTNGSDDAFRIRSQDGTNQWMSVKGNGFVGIGTATPGADLDLLRSTSSISMRVRSTFGFGSSSLSIDRGSTSSGINAQLQFSTAGTPDWFLGTSAGPFGGGDSFFISPNTSGSTSFAMLKANGNVGIGALSAQYKLNVQSSSGIAIAGSAVSPSSNFGNAYVGSASVWGTSTTSVGVFGTSDSNVGVAGVSSSNIGVLGRSSTGNAGYFDGTVVVGSLGSAGSTTLCRNASSQIATCSSSLRYKTNISNFRNGLGLIDRLRPISFDWKDSGIHDLGLGAEDVAKIEPLLVTYNNEGQVEGVKYDRIGVVLINAVKEQQAQIERQQKEIESLKALVCSTNQDADVCKEK